MFDSAQHGQGTAGIHGPALETDEVLFHELVHAARTINGVPGVGLEVNKGYTNEEEYTAIVLSNVYLSEKGKRNFRAGHGNRAVLPDPAGFLNNAQNVNLSPRDLIAGPGCGSRSSIGARGRSGRPRGVQSDPAVRRGAEERRSRSGAELALRPRHGCGQRARSDAGSVAASRQFRMACAGLLPSTVICRRWQVIIGVGDEFFPLPFL